MEILFIQLSGDLWILIKKIETYDWFCGPGSHITQRIKMLCVFEFDQSFVFLLHHLFILFCPLHAAKGQTQYTKTLPLIQVIGIWLIVYGLHSKVWHR